MITLGYKECASQIWITPAPQALTTSTIFAKIFGKK